MTWTGFPTNLFRYLTSVSAIRSGVGFGEAVHSVKALQVALSRDALGHSIDEAGRIEGYGISFNYKRKTREDGHPYSGSKRGMYLGPDSLHEGNHRRECQRKFGGLHRCEELTGVNLNPHEQNHSKKTRHLPTLSNMGFDTFAFTTNLINELENATINQRTTDLAVRSASRHSTDCIHLCSANVWRCGRCFCDTPLMRSFDEFGRLRITHL